MTYVTVVVPSFVMLVFPLAASLACRPVQPSGGDAGPSGKDPAEAGTRGASTQSETEPKAMKQRSNRLADETSLYLLMHAHNPVDWYPWGEEALAKAKAEGKLIFLSIGYSSCYWCHVMERESFMDEEVAVALNRDFVCIKVDREQRPDIDEIYMTALQIYYRVIGSPQGGGWPLTMFLTPDARPVIGGTYFPPRDKNGVPGLLSLLSRVQQVWQDNPGQLQQNAKMLAGLVKQQLQEQPAAEAADLDPRLLDEVLEALAERFDPEHGGFGYSPANPQYPKFPEPSNLVFLLERAEYDRAHGQNDRQAESMLVTTLQKMAAGGIWDHLGGGFHRYSTDRFWAVPHFEKMLYDNAQLASVCAEAYRLTGREAFRRVVEEMLDFVLREMTGPQGEFYSAIDAETDGDEGAFYVWTREELADALEPSQFQLLTNAYDIGEHGNFEERYVLLRPRPLEETANTRGTTEDELWRQLTPIRQKLLDMRAARKRPLTDTKVLTSWNGLMIRGFADAGRILDEPRYTEAAEDAANFVLQKLRTPEGQLRRTYGGGRAQLNAYLEDYAFLADGLIALHRATGNRQWLEEADRLTAEQIERFWDESRGGFFFTSRDHETLIARSKDPADSAIPSGNAVAAGNLVYLAGELNRPEYLERAEETLEAFAPLLVQSPAAMPRMAVALAALLQAHEKSAP